MNSELDKKWSTQSYWQARFENADTPWQLEDVSPVVTEALDLLVAQGVPLTGLTALSPGCGTGLDALECARRGLDVVAVDWSHTAVVDLRSRYNALKEALGGTVQVLEGDLFAVQPIAVDLVVEHTFFCAIDPSSRVRYVQKLLEWVKPGGYVVGNFFIVEESEALRLPNLSLTQEGMGPPFAATASEILSLFSENFECIALRPPKTPTPGRRVGLEWIGVFKRA